MASLIPQDVRDTLGDLAGTWADIQRIKLQNSLAKQQASQAALFLPNVMQDAQARAGSYYGQPSTINPATVGLFVVGAVAVYLLTRG